MDMDGQGEEEEQYDEEVDHGEQQIIDEELGEEMQGEHIDQELEEDGMMDQRDQSPDGEEGDEMQDYGEGEGEDQIEVADQQVQQMM